jgi:hypothetical protein
MHYEFLPPATREQSRVLVKVNAKTLDQVVSVRPQSQDLCQYARELRAAIAAARARRESARRARAVPRTCLRDE